MAAGYKFIQRNKYTNKANQLKVLIMQDSGGGNVNSRQ
jgi:hypothetical protein